MTAVNKILVTLILSSYVIVTMAGENRFAHYL